MIKETDNFIIEYTNCDTEYIDIVIDKLNKKAKDIMSFFKIDKLPYKVIVKIWSNLDDFIVNAPFKLADWCVGYAKGAFEISLLSYDEIIKRKSRASDTINEIPYLVLHEFVHICHNMKNNTGECFDCVQWVGEGIACLLSGQYESKKYRLVSSLDDIKNEKSNNYLEFFTMTKYVFETYGAEYLLTLALNKELSLKETPHLYEETKQFVANFEEKVL